MKLFPSTRSQVAITAAAVMLLANACAPASSTISQVEGEPSPPVEQMDPPAVVVEATNDPNAGWQVYEYAASGFSFAFPEDWYGPEVEDSDQNLRIEIGSDVVYPYGTDRTEQIYTQPDSYYIVVEYRPNTSQASMQEYEESSWIGPMLEILALADGETISTPRSLTTRIREVTLGRFKGVEFIATLPEGAQTERVYLRQLFLMDENLNILMIMGSVNNVTVADTANWKADYQRVDESYLDIFHMVIESIRIG